MGADRASMRLAAYVVGGGLVLVLAASGVALRVREWGKPEPPRQITVHRGVLSVPGPALLDGADHATGRLEVPVIALRRSAGMSPAACEQPSGTPVGALLAQGGWIQVDTHQGCIGWVPASLISARP